MSYSNQTISRFILLLFISGLVVALVISRAENLKPGATSQPTVSKPVSSSSGQPPIRAVWVQPDSLYTQESVDRVLELASAGGFNTIFACVFDQGQTLYSSAYASTSSSVAQGFNPLAYLVTKAHQRGIKVHAWFVSGNMSGGDESPLLLEHPDWALIGPDGVSAQWLNFALPQVQQFFGNLAAEVVERYGVDGVHLDYIRYTSAEWGFDSYSMETFQKQYGIDPNLLRYANLPAYGVITANPLSNPSTANVLATFSNGYPAVTLNRYGKGEVILLNWEADIRNLALNSEILKRSVKSLLTPGGDIFLLHSETNAAQYGYDDLDLTSGWLQFLGWTPKEVDENKITTLSPNSVLVLPGIYLITPATAAQMADFVKRGGGLIFIDGPTLSIGLPDIQAITGMQSRGKYFSDKVIINATGDNPLIPTSQRQTNLSQFQTWEADWKNFRRQGVTLTVQAVYRRVKAISPQAIVSTVIPGGSPDFAFYESLQDWPVWQRTKSIDFLVPLLYVDQVKGLGPELDAWKQSMTGSYPLIAGIISYSGGDQVKKPKSPEQLISELDVLRSAGINNFSIFSLDTLTPEQLASLKKDAQSSRGK